MYQLAKTSMEKTEDIAKTAHELKTALEFLYTAFDVDSCQSPNVYPSEEWGLLFRKEKDFSSRNLLLLKHKKVESLDLFVVCPDQLNRDSCYEFMTRSRNITIQDWQERLYLSSIAEKTGVHGAEQNTKDCYEHKHHISQKTESGIPVLSTHLTSHVSFHWNLNEKDIEKLLAASDACHLFENYQKKRINDVYHEAYEVLKKRDKIITALRNAAL